MTLKSAAVVALLGAGTLVAFGCENTDHDRMSDHHRDRGDVAISHDPLRPADRPTGDAGRGFDAIPRSAVRIREDVANRAAFDPDRPGTLFVYDNDTRQIVYSGLVSASAHVVVDPSAGSVLVNDQQVVRGINSRDRYNVYFDYGGR